MRSPFRPHSRSFRAVLGMALLAWALLASGALAAPLHMTDAMDMGAAMQMTQLQASATHCDGAPMQHAAPDRAPAMPMGHGDCCHGGCHCLTACNAVLGVPYLSLVGHPPRTPLPTFVSAAPATAVTAPPLRPPIA